tara:strand:- start:878 stop:2419 length:1542 start_codon:yes stop_codon:yes gene_type:complete
MERLSMRKIKQVLRLHFEQGASNRRIATSTHISRASVAEYLRRFDESELTWPLSDSLSDTKLEQQLFPPASNIPASQRPVPDWQMVYQDLKNTKNHTTLFLLWQEYKACHVHGYQYSWFCDQFRLWQGKLDVSMRQIHLAGDKLFVDYAGDTIPIIDRRTGEIKRAQVFVAVLGASNYTFSEATWSQSLPDWVGSHVRAFEFLGGVPNVVVPDNLKSAVTKAHPYDPDINPTYADMAEHYGVAVLPARVRKPKDKAKAEGGVLLVERWILAALRHRTFFSLQEANQAISELLTQLNLRAFKKLPGCRRSAFEQIDQPALQVLPNQPYEFAQWKKCRVNIDYHLELEGHYYSVPHNLIKQQLDVRYTVNTVECFNRGVRIASHVRSYTKGRHTTIAEHMPKAHRQYAQWTPERLVKWAEQTGPSTAKLIESILYQRKYPQQGFRSCLGILNLSKSYGATRLEAACERALCLGTQSYRSIASILKQGLDSQPLPEQLHEPQQQAHHNLRGASYYH